MNIALQQAFQQGAIKGAAPKTQPDFDTTRSGAKGLTNILPSFGTNPPKTVLPTSSLDLSERAIAGDPRDLWYLALPAKMTPKQVLMILRSALAGDIWQQWQLFSLMMDSWPMLRKCCQEIRGAVKATKFRTYPYALEGEEPSPMALKKQKAVKLAMTNFKPNPFSDEKAFSGLVYDITDAFLCGIMMSEIVYQERPVKFGGIPYILPRAAAWVHPRHFTFTNEGLIAIGENGKQFTYATQPYKLPDPNRYICAQFDGRTGSSLGAGLLRPLAWWCSAVMFNRDWMFQFAQNWGQPWRWATYKEGTGDDEMQRISKMLDSVGNAGWGMFQEGLDVKVVPQQNLGADNPHRFVQAEADRNCQILLLGQTATTEGTSGKMGGEDTRENVKEGNVEQVASWVGETLTQQFATAVCRLNFGNDDEVPVIESDFTHSPDPNQVATRWSTLKGTGAPLSADQFYKDNGLNQPKEGDVVLVDGKLTIMGKVLTAEEQQQQAIENQQAMFAANNPPQEPEAGGEETPVEGRSRPIRCRGKLSSQQVMAGLIQARKEWLEPVADVFTKIDAKANNGGISTEELLDEAQKIVNQMPTLFNGRNVTKLAKAFDTNMRRAAIQGNRTGDQI